MATGAGHAAPDQGSLSTDGQFCVSVNKHALIAHAPASDLPTALLASQTALLGALLIGFTQASAISADVRASLTVALAAAGNQSAFIAGVRKAAGIAIVLPVVTVLLPWHVWTLGLDVALVHALVGLAAGTLLVAVLLRQSTGVPFVGSFRGPTMPGRTAIAAAGVLAFSWALGGIERFALDGLSTSAALIIAMALAGAFSVRGRDVGDPVAFALEPDRIPDSWTQRLDLTC